MNYANKEMYFTAIHFLISYICFIVWNFLCLNYFSVHQFKINLLPTSKFDINSLYLLFEKSKSCLAMSLKLATKPLNPFLKLFHAVMATGSDGTATSNSGGL